MKHFLAAALALLMTAAASAQNASHSDIRTLAQQSRYQEAYDRLKTYLDRRPGDEQARLLNGVLLTRLERYDDAIEAFRDLAGDKPGLPEPHNNLAVLYAAQGRYDEARESLEKAVALQPGYGTARENLGDIYARLAHLEYMRAYEIDSGNARALDKANTVVNLFERIAKAQSRPAPPPEPITAASEPAPEPAPPPVASVAAGSECFSITNLRDNGDAVAVAAWFEQRGANTRSGVREETVYLNFQVYIPPLESRAAAKARYNELKAIGITDIAIIPRGELRNGISLGVYGTEAAAKRRMMLLTERGYQVDFRQRNRTMQMPYVDVSGFENSDSLETFGQTFPNLVNAPTGCA